jgi:hypothetical protein
MTITVTSGQLHRIISALETMAEIDSENDFQDEAEASRALVETLIDQLEEPAP